MGTVYEGFFLVLPELARSGIAVLKPSYVLSGRATPSSATRVHALWALASLNSQPMKRRLSSRATTPVVPWPRKGSRTSMPSLLCSG